MLHNANVELDIIKKNIELAIQSKLLIFQQGSGRSELAAQGFNELNKSLATINEWLAQAEMEAAKASAPGKKTQ